MLSPGLSSFIPCFSGTGSIRLGEAAPVSAETRDTGRLERDEQISIERLALGRDHALVVPAPFDADSGRFQIGALRSDIADFVALRRCKCEGDARIFPSLRIAPPDDMQLEIGAVLPHRRG